MSDAITLPIQEDAEDRMILRAINPDDHRDWLRILPVSTPVFIHTPEGAGLMVRWWMSRADAERFDFWGHGCQCCGATVPADGDTWEFDTMLAEVAWYLRGKE